MNVITSASFLAVIKSRSDVSEENVGYDTVGLVVGEVVERVVDFAVERVVYVRFVRRDDDVNRVTVVRVVAAS